MNRGVEYIVTLLPFAWLLAGFIVFRLDALLNSLLAWLLELTLVLVFYDMPLVKCIQASLWGSLTMWTGFLVLYTGQIFGQAYRTTGLLQVLLDSVQSILPPDDQRGRAAALTGVIGGFIGTFNGFATYPVTVPGLTALGFGGVDAVVAYLVYFSWQEALVSLFIAANISNAATHLPVADIAHVIGWFTIPLIFICLLGFFKVLGFAFFERRTQTLFWTLGLSNTAAVVIFTQIWPALYILTLIASAAFSLVALYVDGWLVKRRLAAAAIARQHSAVDRLKAYAPLILGALFVFLTMAPGIAPALAWFQFEVSAWGNRPIAINILTSAGFVVLLTGLLCYCFRVKDAKVLSDLVVASRRSGGSLATLFVGSGMVRLMVDSGQIGFLGKALAGGGRLVYATLDPVLALLGGIAFGQGLPADYLFAQMQVSVAPMLALPLVVLVGMVTVATMGPPNGLKPAIIKYTASLANVKGQDAAIFRRSLPWQLLQVAALALLSAVIVVLWQPG
jgi:hypothetical protein